jgi:hypothetical protein
VGLRFSKCTGGSVDFVLAAPRICTAGSCYVLCELIFGIRYLKPIDNSQRSQGPPQKKQTGDEEKRSDARACAYKRALFLDAEAKRALFSVV